MIRSRSWRWFEMRVEGLLTRPVSLDAAGNPVFGSRVQELCQAPVYARRLSAEGG